MKNIYATKEHIYAEGSKPTVYFLKRKCTNCDYDLNYFEKGTRVEDHICENCECISTIQSL